MNSSCLVVECSVWRVLLQQREIQHHCSLRGHVKSFKSQHLRTASGLREQPSQAAEVLIDLLLQRCVEFVSIYISQVCLLPVLSLTLPWAFLGSLYERC